MLVSAGLAAHAVPTVVGQGSFPAGYVVDTRTWTSPEAPALLTDSAAVNMQHMGVVRDFALSDAPLPPAPTLHLDGPNGGERFVLGASVEVRWTATGLASVDVDYAADGVNFSRIAAGVNAGLGAIGWTVPAPATTTGVLRVSSGALADASDAPFTVAAPARVIINEVLANEPGSTTAAEFVELYNAGGSAADLSGWTLSDATAVRHVFALGTTLAPGQTLVVFGAASGIPVGLGNAVASSTGTLSLNNGGDTVTLAQAGVVVDTVTYASALAAVDGVSMNRAIDRSGGAFVLHSGLSGLLCSPGVSVLGAP